MYKDRITIDQLPLERLFLDTVVLKIPLGSNEHITSDLIQGALADEGVSLRKGDALLIGTGWDRKWNDPDYCPDPPHFTAEAIDWMLDQEVALLGADTPRFDGRSDPQNFFPKFFQRDILLLAPLVNLYAVRKPRVKLIVLPLKVVGACAAPCRAVILEE